MAQYKALTINTESLPLEGDLVRWNGTNWVPYADSAFAAATHASEHEIGGSDLVNHNNLTGYVAKEHIDWTNTSAYLSTTASVNCHGVNSDDATNHFRAGSAGTGQSQLYFDTYNDNGIAYSSTLRLRKSHNATINGMTATINNEILGAVLFNGVNTNGIFDYGAQIKVTQIGNATTTSVPCQYEIRTDNGTTLATRLLINSSGNVKISGSLEIDGALNHDGTTVGFYTTTPVTQNQLATGAGKTVDEVITELQRLGLVRQAA